MLKNKIVLVTGGAGLLGKEFIKQIISNNGIAIIADIDLNQAKNVKKQLSNNLNGDNIDYVSMDITSKESILGAIDYCDKKYGKIDALVNNAYPRNKTYGANFFDVSYDSFCENINMNIGGYFLTSQQFALHFKKQKYGNIINISSIYGVIAPKFEIYKNTSITMPVEYAAIKSSLIHLTKYMAKYFKGMNIRVNAISPGGIFDHQKDDFVHSYNKECINKGMLNPSDLGGALIYLLSDMSLYQTGQNLIIDDGFVL